MPRFAGICCSVAMLFSVGCVSTVSQPITAFAGPGYFAATGRTRTIRQLVTVEYQGERQSYSAIMQVSVEQITVVGFGSFGVQLFSLSWDDSGVQYRANPVFEPLFEPRALYSDMQFALLAPRELAEIAVGRLQVEMSENGERTVLMDGDVRLKIQFDSGTTWDEKFLMQYTERPLQVLVRSIAE